MAKETSTPNSGSAAPPAAPAAAPSPADHTQSFAQRKAAQLAAERVESRLEERRPQRDTALTEREPPGDPLDSDEDDEQRESDIPDDELDPEDPEALDPDADELPEGDDDQDAPTLRKRLSDAHRKLREHDAARKVEATEHAEIMGTHLGLKHEWQDALREAKQFASAYVGGFTQEIQRIEQACNTGMVHPDQLPAARQQHQMLCQQRATILGQIEELNRREGETRKRERERQAEVARVRLGRTIPGWSREKHAEIGEYAVSRGYSPEEFTSNLDYRFIELLHDSMLLRRAGDAVKRVQHKQKAQRSARNAPTQARSADGRFRQAQKAFRDNPGQKGRFAEMKLRELQKERR